MCMHASVYICKAGSWAGLGIAAHCIRQAEEQLDALLTRGGLNDPGCMRVNDIW